MTAIDLFFNDRDPVSVQALAGNARELFESLCRLENIEPMTELLVRDNHRERKDIYAAMNLYRNPFKHLGKGEAERAENQQILNQFDDSKNDPLLYICVEDYLRLRKRRSPLAMQVFQLWFVALHLDLLVDASRPQFEVRVNDAFPGIRDLPRAEQKRRGLEALRNSMHDAALRTDPHTEPD